MEKTSRDILPATGIWSVEDFAIYLGTAPADLLNRLQTKGVPVLHLGARYKAKFIRLEDLRSAA